MFAYLCWFVIPCEQSYPANIDDLISEAGDDILVSISTGCRDKILISLGFERTEQLANHHLNSICFISLI